MTENALRHTRQTKCNCFDTSCNYCNDSSSNLTVNCWHAYHVDVLYTSSNHAELKEVVLCLRTIQSTRTADVCGPAKLSTNITAASHKGGRLRTHALTHTHTHAHGDSQRGWAETVELCYCTQCCVAFAAGSRSRQPPRSMRRTAAALRRKLTDFRHLPCWQWRNTNGLVNCSGFYATGMAQVQKFNTPLK